MPINGEEIMKVLAELQEPSTALDIAEHIAKSTNKSVPALLPEVEDALDGGVEYGYIEKYNQHYFSISDTIHAFKHILEEENQPVNDDMPTTSKQSAYQLAKAKHAKKLKNYKLMPEALNAELHATQQNVCVCGNCNDKTFEKLMDADNSAGMLCDYIAEPNVLSNARKSRGRTRKKKRQKYYKKRRNDKKHCSKKNVEANEKQNINCFEMQSNKFCTCSQTKTAPPQICKNHLQQNVLKAMQKTEDHNIYCQCEQQIMPSTSTTTASYSNSNESTNTVPNPLQHEMCNSCSSMKVSSEETAESMQSATSSIGANIYKNLYKNMMDDDTRVRANTNEYDVQDNKINKVDDFCQCSNNKHPKPVNAYAAANDYVPNAQAAKKSPAEEHAKWCQCSTKKTVGIQTDIPPCQNFYEESSSSTAHEIENADDDLQLAMHRRRKRKGHKRGPSTTRAKRARTKKHK